MTGIPIHIAAPSIQSLPTSSGVGATGSSETKNLFQHLISQANNDQLVSDNAIRDFIEQKPGTNVQQVVMAVAQAEMSFNFFMEIRNQLIDSYSELSRMQF